MQLTQLEIKGFKSFGDKITINFNEGITAIVGPNGCGKSNVVDAIRWVLGEQSTKTLRSEKMENIIFNGTKTRKPAQLAEVSLSFSNTKNILPTAFSQVTITRKLYRNGESEYRLNNVQCRLKDINDLFLDTGIGSDSYAIIELKMVEEIISNKEHSRRSLFEEASGISKYKVRKKQTISKLKDTENDLSRVDDLLYEIEKNLKTLESQARKTERYYKIKEQYKLLSLSLASLRITGIRHSLQVVEQKNMDEEIQKITISTEIARIEAFLQHLKKETVIKEQNLSTQQKVFNEKLAEIRNFETDKKIKNEQLHHLKEKEEQLIKNIQQDKQQKNHVLYQLKRLREELLEANIKLESLELDLIQRSQEIEVLRYEEANEKETLNSLSKEKNELQNKIYELEKSIAVINIQCDALTQENKRTLSDEQSREMELIVFNEKLHELDQQILAFQENEDSIKRAEEALEEEAVKTEQELNSLREQQQQQSRLLDAKRNEYSLTKSLVDNLEGFPESIKFLRKSTSWAKGIPLFSDILFCKEEYRIAIENFLEPYMNFYVVDTLQDAFSAVHLLHESGKGRAGFFVLESIPTYDGHLNDVDHLLPALAVVEIDAKYKTLCQHLLNQVFINEHPFDKSFENLPKGDITILNKKGNYITNSLSVSGGSFGLFDGKRIGRSKNLENLAKEIKKLENRQEHDIAEIRLKTEKLSTLKNESQKSLLEEIRLQINKLTKEHISIKSKQEQYKAFLQENTDRKKTIEEKIGSLQNDLVLANPQLLSLQHALQISQANFIDNQERFSSVAEKLSKATALYNEVNINVHQQKNRVSGIDKDIDYRTIQIETFEKQLGQKESELNEVLSAINKTLQHADVSDDDLRMLYEQKNQIEKGLQEFEKEYYTDRGKIDTEEGKITSLRKKKEISDTLINEIKEEKTKLAVALTALKERLSIEFSIELDELDSIENILEDETSLQTKIDKIKKQIDDFGAINPIAMQTFQEMDNRYQFIIKEKNDLLEARAALLETIQEIDQNAEAKFMAAFLNVRENFIKVFRSLFSEEDTCDLVISGSENPLEADIEIIAKPKGKRPLSITQLSGGEKTLTATALLFSLYLLKPAPFCIFDEVDAPLDDSNIDKFNNIIRDFSGNSQFIIVSHNKRTIASTDVIYGVTMVESGISRVVAVDMREVQSKAS